jgi:DUF3047 family protein
VRDLELSSQTQSAKVVCKQTELGRIMKQHIALAGALAISLAHSAVAQNVSLLEGPWETIGVPGEAETRFRIEQDGSLSVVSDSSVAFRYLELDTAGEMLSWRWRVDNMGPPSDPMIVGADDRPIAVHLWFPEQDDQSSLFGGLAELFGYPSVGNALTYTWGGAPAQPRLMPNPHLADGQGALISLQTEDSTVESWMSEVIDYRADFQAAFGKQAPVPSYIAISGDSDDLGGLREARIADLRFINE